jgi:hypothetical protein
MVVTKERIFPRWKVCMGILEGIGRDLQYEPRFGRWVNRLNTRVYKEVLYRSIDV